MRFLITLWISKMAAFAVNLIDKNRGTNFAGSIAVKLMPGFIAGFKGVAPSKVIFISGTNGKSTTTNLLAHTLSSAGKTVACNLEGANMMAGVATTLIKNSTLSGRMNKEYLVLEIDERSLPGIRKLLPGTHLGITNLQKDQVQRNGDPDFVYRKFVEATGKDMTLYLNNEEPRSRSLENYSGKTIYFGVAENERSYRKDDDYHVTLPCPKCGCSIRFEHYNLAGIGRFSCSKCDYTSFEHPDILVTDVDYKAGEFTCGGRKWTITYKNPFYIYNYAMIIGICRELGISDDAITAGFASFVNPANHDNIFHYHGKQIHYLRVKQENPEALQSQLDIIAADKRRKAVFMGLYEVTDFLPHYAGCFYFFDCDFSPIVQSDVEQYVAFSTTVCHDIASRMIYAGADENTVTVLDTEDVPTILSKIDDVQTDLIYFITNIKHYKPIKAYLQKGDEANA